MAQARGCRLHGQSHPAGAAQARHDDDDDDDVYYCNCQRLKLEGETENMCVWTKKRGSMNAVVLMATPCPTVRHRGMGTLLMGTILKFASVPLRKMGTDLLGSWWPCQCVLPLCMRMLEGSDVTSEDQCLGVSRLTLFPPRSE